MGERYVDKVVDTPFIEHRNIPISAQQIPYGQVAERRFVKTHLSRLDWKCSLSDLESKGVDQLTLFPFSSYFASPGAEL